jgi:flagellar export protein FliJ
MRRFRFRLERLRRYRAMQAEQAEQALAIALQEAARVDAALGVTRGEAAAEAQALRGRLAQQVSGADLGLHAGYASALAQRMRRLEQDREARRRGVAERRAEFRERRRASEVVEQLRQQALAGHRQETEREGQAFLDELGGIRAARRIPSETE